MPTNDVSGFTLLPHLRANYGSAWIIDVKSGGTLGRKKLGRCASMFARDSHSSEDDAPAVDESRGRSAVVSGSPTPAEWTPPPKSSFLIIVDRLDAFFRIVLHAIDFATNRIRLHQAFIVGP
jgi:hypothetical protein